ncbi:hypothetical protein GCM10007242_16640 [Pigmentiphaga litoralis]|nr:hypothetical protein GCM10007242_16640 [Pigmentiphaga litoralis]
MRSPSPVSIKVETDMVYETVHTAKLYGLDLENVLVTAVAAQLGLDLTQPGTKVKCCFDEPFETINGMQHGVTVTVAVDHRPQGSRNADVD